MPFHEREIIISNLEIVDEVLGFDDDEKGSCSFALEKIKSKYPEDEIIFCNGGDRKAENIPEMSVEGIAFKFGVGGDYKINSSSSILKEWQFDGEERVWGKFYNLFRDHRLKLKELIVEPGKGMSFQKHFKRSEIWMVSKGSCVVNYSKNDPDNKKSIQLNKFDHYLVPLGEWHKITNPFDETCHIIEIQYGEECVEDDIERTEHHSTN